LSSHESLLLLQARLDQGCAAKGEEDCGVELVRAHGVTFVVSERKAAIQCRQMTRT